jgi:methylenetetrahydrofolate--tRNA-(uracil-5-)-methyltransferase
LGRVFPPPPPTTALGALHGHVLGKGRAPGASARHMPSNIHWGLFPALDAHRVGKRDRKRLYGERALADLGPWIVALESALAAPAAPKT